jgi:hypothetical protein
MLLAAARAMQDAPSIWGDHRHLAIRLHHRRVTSQAAASSELAQSPYGEPFTAYHDKVKRSLEEEYVRDGPDAPGPDWPSLEAEGRQLAADWGCP